VELDVAWLVDTVNVAEAGCDRKVWGDLLECFVDPMNVFWLSVERVVVDIFVVDAILFTTRDTNFLLQSQIAAELLHRFHLPSPATVSLVRPA